MYVSSLSQCPFSITVSVKLSTDASIPFPTHLQADITAMITRKSALSRPKSTESRLELNRKRTEHSLAIKRKDYDAAEKLAAEIADMEMTLSMTAPPAPKPDRADDTMAKLNEKNRKAQAEAIRKSDADNKEKRRLAALASGVRCGRSLLAVSIPRPSELILPGLPFTLQVLEYVHSRNGLADDRCLACTLRLGARPFASGRRYQREEDR
jgi:hypothetical protein